MAAEGHRVESVERLERVGREVLGAKVRA